MKLLSILTAAAYVPMLISAQVPPPCTAQRRADIAKNITPAFNDPDFAESAARINAMPLTADCSAIVYVDDAPGIKYGIDATSTKNFANIVRQAFVNVQSKYTDYGNGTLLMDAMVVNAIPSSTASPDTFE